MGSMSRPLAFLLVACLMLVQMCQAVKVTGAVKVHNEVNLPTFVIKLNNGEHGTITRLDGSFEFEDLEEGDYSLEVQSPQYGFPKYTVHVQESGTTATFVLPNRKLATLRHPLRLDALGRPNYFEPRKQMNMMGVFKNPMVLMMGFMMFMTVVMPKLMGAVDPEEMEKIQEEMRKNQGDQPDLNKMVSNMFGSKGAGGNDSDSD
eukprot:CAMPEP_0184507662 /NCGR_PEP_ID=MMETSP0198_2-20121128/355_1 /TAXON_ID=1112570 /ORGANISM="Thraustochytrium sp., Strain LLF1b" /LENGTH=203 /DNA_ID=CAMNT_0026897411 /DNA_START=131 /DNA_END=742 /DNA_ORIENTATION=+